MEINFLNWINQNLHGSNFINQVVKIITILGDTGLIWIVLGLVLLIFKKTRKGGILVLCGIVATGVINNLMLKPIINRARPFTHSAELVEFIKSINLELPDSPSFPSGHTFASFCSAIILTLWFGKKGAFSYIGAVLISLSRIFLCVHYPSDVLAGAILGTAVGVGTYFLVKWLMPKCETFILNFIEKHKLKKQGAKNAPCEQDDINTNQNVEE